MQRGVGGKGHFLILLINLFMIGLASLIISLFYISYFSNGPKFFNSNLWKSISIKSHIRTTVVSLLVLKRYFT